MIATLLIGVGALQPRGNPVERDEDLLGSPDPAARFNGLLESLAAVVESHRFGRDLCPQFVEHGCMGRFCGEVLPLSRIGGDPLEQGFESSLQIEGGQNDYFDVAGVTIDGVPIPKTDGFYVTNAVPTEDAAAVYGFHQASRLARSSRTTSG